MNAKARQFISCGLQTEAEDTKAQEIMHVDVGTLAFSAQTRNDSLHSTGVPPLFRRRPGGAE